MNGFRSTKQGFTLVELLIAMLIFSLLLGSMYSVYTSHYNSFRKQEQIAEAQQNARGALQLISSDIIMAGYNTTSTGITFANTTSLTVNYNATNFSYSRYSSARIGRRTAGTPQAVAERIRRLSFKYYSTHGGSFPGNVPSANLDSVRQIKVSITAGTPVFSGYSGSCTLEAIVSPRNL